MKEKFIKGLKKYRAYLYSALVVVVFAVVLTLSLVASSPKTDNSVVVNTTSSKFIMPVSNATITLGYDEEEPQYFSDLNCWKIHKGLDLSATVGDDVLATFDGKVSSITNDYFEGTIIEISHENGLKSVYSGLNSETKVEVGDSVSGGQSLGTVGNNQDSETSSHIHFELIKDGEQIDPLNYIEISLKD